MIDQSLWESVSGGYENWNVLNFDILLRDVKKNTHMLIKILVLQWL